MKKYQIIVTGILLFFSVCYIGNSLIPQQVIANDRGKRHNLVIKSMKKNWRVVKDNDSTKSTITVKRGDMVVWHVIGTDAFFQFFDENLFGEYTAKVKNGKKLELVVGEEAKSGPNFYSVFCTSDSIFATGDSPPKIIVE